MANTGRMVAIIAGIVAVLLVIRVGIGITRRPDDQALIRQALKDSLQDSKQGKPGSVLDLLSDKLTVNADKIGADPRQIADFIRKQKPDITLENDHAVVTGDEARIVSPVDLKVSLLGQGMERRMKEVTLVFHKEDTRGFLFLPETKWKLAEIRLPDNAVQDLLTGGLL